MKRDINISRLLEGICKEDGEDDILVNTMKNKKTRYYISNSYINNLESAEAPTTIWIKVLKAPIEIEEGIKHYQTGYKCLTIKEIN